MTLQIQRVFVAALAIFLAHSTTAKPQDITPEEAVSLAAQHELATSGHHPFRYTIRKTDDGKITTKEMIETKDGDVARLIAINDKPLPPDLESDEVERLQNLLKHPDLQSHRHKREQADTNRADEMIRLLPTAFIYQFEGVVKGPNGPCYRLSMKPNPSFKPPDREAEVFAGMAGELLIDQKQERMVELKEHLIADVNFGWGIVGKLYKGGTIVVEQKDVGDGHWEQTLQSLRLQGRILMIKSLTIDTTQQESDYSPVPADWTYQDAVKALLSEKH